MVYPHRTSSIPLACHAAYPEWRRSSWQRLDPRARTSSAEYWTQWRRDIEILCFVTQLSVSLFFLSRWLRDHVTLTRETRLQRRVRVKRVLREKEPTTRWWRRKEEKWVEEREREREKAEKMLSRGRSGKAMTRGGERETKGVIVQVSVRGEVLGERLDEETRILRRW